jgi:hypothetical protein
MEQFVRSPDNSRDFQQDVVIGVGGFGDLDKLNLKIAIKHKSNWHNEAVRATRRSKFMCALVLAMKKIPIYNPGGGNEALGAPGNPTYSVAVSDEVAAANRDEAAKKKEEKRMVPSPDATKDKDEAQTTEKDAVKELNTRNPVADAADDWGYARDDKTLSSREQSEDRRRSTDIENIRQELIKRGESQHGLRKAGETLPPRGGGGVGGAPGVQLTQASPRSRTTFDEEAQMGSAYPGQRAYYPTTTTTNISGGAPAASGSGTGYSIFPSARPYSPPEAQGQGVTPHPLQSAPTAQGQRARGPSVSRTQPPGLPPPAPGNFR